MANGELQTQAAKVAAQSWGKPYSYVGIVSHIQVYPDPESPVIHLELQTRAHHQWIAHVESDRHQYYRTDGIKKGTYVRIEFLHHGYALGVHKLTSIRKATLLDRLKIRFLGRL